MNSKPFEIPKMPILPEERLKKSSPFKSCGLDYAGPFQIKSENKIIKIWIEVFTCLSTRFSHLELIKDLSANSCVQAFRRFVAEYGKPSLVISDNGTQYRLSQKVINEIERKIEGEKIEWRFIPAVSPWFGGVYESIIKIMKKSLKNAIGKRMLNIEELRTLLPEIKYVMNSRPLTYVYNKNEDYEVLRPLDLVQPLRLTDEIKFEELETDNYEVKSSQKTDIINSWKNAQKTVNDFWEKFQKEYLNDLKERAERHTQKHFKKNYAPKIGEIVLIQNINLPKQFWNLGRIVNLIKSKDGSIRTAKIKCKNKIINRAIALLYPLELNTFEGSEKVSDDKAQNSEKMTNENKQKESTHPMKLRERKIKQKIVENNSSDEEIESGKCMMFFENRWRPCAYCGGPHMDYECGYYQSSSNQREAPQRNQQQRNPQKESKYNKLIEENKEIKKELENINEDIVELQDLEDEVKGFKNSSKELENKNKKLEEELKEYKDKTNFLEEKIIKIEEGLESKFNEMKIENERIKNDMKRLIRDIYIKPPEKTKKTKKQSTKNSKNKSKLNKEKREKGNGNGASTSRSGLVTTIGAISILFLTLFGNVKAGPCKVSEKTALVDIDECMADGFTINKRVDGTLCWRKYNIEKEKYLKNKCLCPTWAIACSFYNGKEIKNSRKENKYIRDIIERNKPNGICSLSPDPNCKNTPTIKNLYQVELYDGSKFFVKELKIELREIINEEVNCIGKGEITGSPLFCSKNPCSENGRKFCFYLKNEIAYFNTGEDKFIVKAWGSIEKQIYDFKNEKEKECDVCQLECTEEGVMININTKIGGIEICLKKCIYISFPEDKEKISLPKEELINGYELKGMFFKNGEIIKEIHIKCEPVKMCKLVECFFCRERILNPKCNPELAMILIALIIYFCSNLIYVLIRLTLLTLKFIIWILNKKFLLLKYIYKRSKKQNNEKEEKSKEKIEKKKFIKNTRNKRLPMKVMLAFLTFLSLAQNTKSLTTITADQEKCTINKMGYRNCLFEKILEMNFNPNMQEINILLQDYQENNVGSMKFLMHRIKAKCVKVIKYYSRSYDIQIISGWRCPYTGSCTELKCSSLKMNETIEELEVGGKRYPGITRCMETEGGWANGCFYVTPACLFYKYSATPTNEFKILEIFKCPKWDLELDIKVIIETQNDTMKQLISLRPGRTAEWNDLKITATSMTVAPLPILNELFISDSKRIAILEKDNEKLVESFKCPTYRSALEFTSCKIDPMTCDCNSADHNVACLCNELLDLDQVFPTDLTLPFEHNAILLNVEKGTITAAPDFSAVQIHTQIKGLALKTEILINKCKITQAQLFGCYNCQKGAKLKITCITDFGNSLGNIIFPSLNTFTICNPKGENRTISVHLNHAMIKETCEIFCGSSSFKFELNAELDHPEELAGTAWKVNHDSWIKEIWDIDVMHLVKYLFVPRYLLILIISILFLIFLFYCLLPFIIKRLIFKLWKFICARSVLTDSTKFV